MGDIARAAIKFNKRGKPAIPMGEILADLYCNSIPGTTELFTDILKKLEDHAKSEISETAKALGISAITPHPNSFNNCRGSWSELIFSAFAWNELAKVNSNLYDCGGPIYIFVKLPNYKGTSTKWTALLDTTHHRVIQSFDRHAKSDKEVAQSGHDSFLLNSSNPDVAILKYSVEEYTSIVNNLSLDPLHPITDLSLLTQKGFEEIFKSLVHTVTPRKNLHCFLSVKDSLKPDRRLQFLHEGNNVKTILLYLINERNACDELLNLDILRNIFYAVSFKAVGPSDKKSLDAAMVACLTSPSLPKLWAVDRLYECLSQRQVEAMFSQIIP